MKTALLECSQLVRLLLFAAAAPRGGFQVMARLIVTLARSGHTQRKACRRAPTARRGHIKTREDKCSALYTLVRLFLRFFLV